MLFIISPEVIYIPLEERYSFLPHWLSIYLLIIIITIANTCSAYCMPGTASRDSHISHSILTTVLLLKLLSSFYRQQNWTIGRLSCPKLMDPGFKPSYLGSTAYILKPQCSSTSLGKIKISCLKIRNLFWFSPRQLNCWGWHLNVRTPPVCFVFTLLTPFTTLCHTALFPWLFLIGDNLRQEIQLFKLYSYPSMTWYLTYAYSINN